MRPRPAPFSRVVKYGSKIRFRFFSGMPTPVSATSIFTYGPGLTYAISPGPMMTFAPRIRTVPPPGIACAALVTRLPIAWPICPASASVAQRSSAIPNSHRTGIPWTDSRADSRTTLSREIRSRTGFPPFEKVRSLEASSSARSEALSAASSLATALLRGVQDLLRQGDVPEDRGEEIVEVVGDAAGEGPEGLQLLPLDQLLFLADLHRHVPEDEDRPGDPPCTSRDRGRAVVDQPAGSVPRDQHVLLAGPRIGLPLGQRIR